MEEDTLLWCRVLKMPAIRHKHHVVRVSRISDQQIPYTYLITVGSPIKSILSITCVRTARKRDLVNRIALGRGVAWGMSGWLNWSRSKGEEGRNRR